MVFRDYCIVVLGKSDGALMEIVNISDNKPKILPAKGILICTFNSVADANELEDYFTSLGRSFFLFEVGADNTGYNLTNKEVHEGLFGEIESKDNDLSDKSKSLLNAIQESVSFQPISGNTPETNTRVDKETKAETKKVFIEESYENLSREEKIDLINEILDKGHENMDEYDKKVLKALSKTK